jgi:arginyl-tRNA synthetase
MQKYRALWRDAIAASLSRIAGVSGIDPATVVVETPPSPEMGDIAFPMFPFARVMRKAPNAIAGEVANALSAAAPPASAPGTVAAEGPYVNVRLDRSPIIDDIIADIRREGVEYGKIGDLAGKRIMIEFSCPNTNKPLHLGHLRNDVLGESLSRILREAGAELIKVNLINDRGVHICQSMISYRMFGGGSTPGSASLKGDHFVGDFYVRYHQWAKEHPEAEEAVREMLRAWEEGDAEVRALWKKMNDWVIEGIGETYARTGVSFDKVYRESDIYELGRAEVIAGIEKGKFQKDPDGSVWVDLSGQGLDREVLLRADGTTLYLTQDIGTAIQRSRDWPFDKLIYVVASEQRYHFMVLFKTLALLGYSWAENLHHLAYGMVHLPEGKMKSREGTVVDADNLLDELEGLAAEEIKTKEREAAVGDIARTSRDISLGALNYYLLSTSPQKDMTFDPRESIAFNGNTGPYLQYTGARISSMLAKFEERKDKYRGGSYSASVLTEPAEWEMAKSLAMFPEAVSGAAKDLNPSIITGYLYDLCKAFSRYYQDNPVLQNPDPGIVHSRITLVGAVREVLRNGCRLLGIPFLEVM